jgi:hypothetical protein
MFYFHLSDVCGMSLQQLLFAVIHSTAIALPAWRQFCQVHELKPKLIPQDITCYASRLILLPRASLMLLTYHICTTGPLLPSTRLTSDFAAI